MTYIKYIFWFVIFRSFCYTVDFNRSITPERTTYKLVDHVFRSFDNDWVMLIGIFNLGTMDQLHVAGGRNTLFYIRDV